MTEWHERLERRRTWPRWLNLRVVPIAITVSGALAYAVMFTFGAAFGSVFGVSPEELGLTQASLVVRAAIYGIVGLGVLLVLAIALGTSWLFLRFLLRVARSWVGSSIRGHGEDVYRADAGERARRWARRILGNGDQVWSISAIGRIRREAWLVALGSAVLPAALMALVDRSVAYFPVYLLVSALVLHPVVRRRYAVGVVVSAVALLAILFLSADRLGVMVGMDLLARAHSPFSTLIGVPGQVVVDGTVDDLPLRGTVSGELILLGNSTNLTVLTDNERVFRVLGDGSLLVTEVPGSS